MLIFESKQKVSVLHNNFLSNFHNNNKKIFVLGGGGVVYASYLISMSVRYWIDEWIKVEGR